MENQEVNPIPQAPVTPPPAGGPQILMPGAILWMIFGIISVILCWYGFIPVAGIFLAIISLVFAILAFTKGKKMMAEFQANPGKYKPASAGLIKTAKITGLIGLIISCIMLVVGIIVTIVAFTASSSLRGYDF
jgi:prolipoprotein diacylglyceryltransferase